DGRLYTCDLARPKQKARPLGVLSRLEVRGLHFDAEGRRLLFVTPEGELGVWDWKRGKRSPPTGQKGFQSAVRGQWVATSSPARGVSVFDLDGHRPLYELPPESSDVWSLAWSPDGKSVAVGLSDGGLAVWDLEQVRARLEEFGIAVPSTAVQRY